MLCARVSLFRGFLGKFIKGRFSLQKNQIKSSRHNRAVGLNFEERILRLHWMVHALVLIQRLVNKRNVKYKRYGPWGHFPKEMFGTKSCTVDDASSASDSDSDSDSNFDSDSDSTADSDSGSSLASCSPDSLLSGPNYSPDDE